jgi:hypothetical protein
MSVDPIAPTQEREHVVNIKTYMPIVLRAFCRVPTRRSRTHVPRHRIRCPRLRVQAPVGGHVQQAYVDAGLVIAYACEPSIPITATDFGSARSSAATKRLLSNDKAALIAASTIFSAFLLRLPAALKNPFLNAAMYR